MLEHFRKIINEDVATEVPDRLDLALTGFLEMDVSLVQETRPDQSTSTEPLPRNGMQIRPRRIVVPPTCLVADDHDFVAAF